MTGLALLRPWWLAVAALLVVGLWWRLSRRGRIGDWDRAVDPHLLAAMQSFGRIDPGVTRPARHPLLWTVGLVGIALAGPSVPVRDAQAFRNLDGVVFVVDISPSMTESAAWPAAVTLARSALNALGSRPAALVVYGGDAYLASELTTDLEQIGFTLSLIDAGTMPDPGSRPALGLDLAARVLAEAEIVAGDVVWITDGGGVDAGLAPAVAALDDLGAAMTVARAGDARLDVVTRLGDVPILGIDDTAGLAERLSAASATARLGRIDLALIGRADLGRYLLLPALALLAFRLRRVA